MTQVAAPRPRSGVATGIGAVALVLGQVRELTSRTARRSSGGTSQMTMPLPVGLIATGPIVSCAAGYTDLAGRHPERHPRVRNSMNG